MLRILAIALRFYGDFFLQHAMISKPQVTLGTAFVLPNLCVAREVILFFVYKPSPSRAYIVSYFFIRWSTFLLFL